jgi:hypothetical protein
MMLNGLQVPITSNLAAFLIQRREPNKEVILWVDALCIDQSNTQDKNQQVPQMSMVYAVASMLTIWLGCCENNSGLAIDELRRLGAASPYDKMPVLSTEVSDAIRRLFERPWWKRTWIVQEVVFGGMSTKLKQIRIQCGPDRTCWTNLVIAAVRMKAHQDDLRWYPPAVASIMDLDSLRDGFGILAKDPGYRDHRFDLLCRFRRFLATNPRDKVYALYNMFYMLYSDPIEVQYEASVEDIYYELARSVIASESGLEILRHCTSTIHDLPSWVPDWSHVLPCRPLPARSFPRYLNVPWWAEPIRDSEDDESLGDLTGEKPKSNPIYKVSRTDKDRKARLRRLELSARGSGIVNSINEIPINWKIRKTLVASQDRLGELVLPRDVVIYVQDDRMHYSGDASTEPTRNPLYEGEITTERRMKSWLLQRLENTRSEPPYCATLKKELDAQVNLSNRTLTLSGMILEAIESSCEPFVNDLESDWKRATLFMVSLGCCKKFATSHAAAKSKYTGQGGLLKAFWTTIFAGKPIPPTYVEDDIADTLSGYDKWLPEVPEPWSWSCPPLTATTSGQLDYADGSQIYKTVVKESNETNRQEHQLIVDFLMDFDGLIPKDWAQPERELYKADFQELGAMWKKQPYDLFHRPFELFHVVPDPYWEPRKDSMSNDGQRTQRSHRIAVIPNSDRDDATASLSERLSSSIEERLSQTPPMLSSETLWPGLEKYALGRRFFITKDGYFGLGPPDTQSGDRLALLFGSAVPFVLRKVSADSGRVQWKLVGETYVHGMMRGELLSRRGTQTNRVEQITLI